METEDEKAYKNLGQEIHCFFKTNLLEKYKIDENQQYTVKTEFTEKNLSELIQHILQEEDPDLEEEFAEGKLKFEFLINGEFLKGNIKSHLLKHKITTEKEITIYYTFGINKPKEDKKTKEEDWISDLSILQEFGKKGSSQYPFVASLFNGDIALYDSEINQLFRQNLTDVPVKQTIFMPTQDKQTENKNIYCISACQDELVRVGLLSQTGKKAYSYTSVAECVGQDSSVNCLDINPLLPHQFCSGSFSGKLNIYNLTDRELSGAGNSFTTNKNGKKVKLEKKSIEPIQDSQVHTESITKCLYKTQHQIYTASLDHSVKLYDTQKVQQVSQIGTKDSAVTSMNFYGDNIITGHEDSYIKTYDFREGNKGPTNIYKSHSLWVSDIQMVPQNSNQFISASYDHSIKLWDMRSQYPVFTLKSHHDKIFSIMWNGDFKIISAGSDQEITSHVFNQ